MKAAELKLKSKPSRDISKRSSKKSQLAYAKLSLFLLLLVFSSVLLPLKAEDHQSADPSAKRKAAAPKTGAKYKAGISRDSKDSRAKAGVSEPELNGSELIYLRADLYSQEYGRKNDIEPFYIEEKGMTAAKFGHLVNSPLVQRRITLWRSWYTSFFDAVCPELSAIPRGFRAKINITVTKDRKITATYEWMNLLEKEFSAAGSKFGEEMIAKLRSLNSQNLLAFPEKSYMDMVQMDLYIEPDRVHLGNGRHKLDFD